MAVFSRYYVLFLLAALVALGLATYSLGTAGTAGGDTTLEFKGISGRVTEYNPDYRVMVLEKEEAEESLEESKALREEMEARIIDLEEAEIRRLLEGLLDLLEEEETRLKHAVNRLEIEKEILAENLTGQAEKLYHTYFALKGEEAILYQNLGYLEELFDLMKEKRKQGMVTWQEVERAVIQVEQGQLLLDAVQGRQEDILGELKMLTGYDLDVSLRLVAPPEPEPEELNRREAIEHAVNEGLTVKIYEKEVELVNGEKEALKLEQAKRNARLQVEKAYRSVKEAENTYRLKERKLELAKNTLERLEARHEAGLVDGLELMEVNLKLMEAHQEHYEAELGYRRALHEFRLAREGALLNADNDR